MLTFWANTRATLLRHMEKIQILTDLPCQGSVPIQSPEWSIYVTVVSGSTSTWKSLLLYTLPNLRSACNSVKNLLMILKKYHRVCQTHIMYCVLSSLFLWFICMDLANGLCSNQPPRGKKGRNGDIWKRKGLTMDHVWNLYLVCLRRTASHVLECCARLRNRAQYLKHWKSHLL